ncbi:uncharacterized protein [Blastocystis hominis]|uniref:Uncharacterized protein n=1 Tax=Blastocystis hominis TaxID=12968 RepID=D8M991_BLAHO|nr:uncharacterized protein [Blastocystis hominis]CBK24630.2 unnamed protein product [Blastocystis hominis]|eukprot:XP_012898678.1 uncharacterized protein [Blastocystis hominis]
MTFGKGVLKNIIIVLSLVIIGFMMTTTLLLTRDYTSYIINKRSPSTSQESSSTSESYIDAIQHSPLFIHKFSENEFGDRQQNNGKMVQSSSNTFDLYPDDTFDITLVTYASASMYELAPKYCRQWEGPIVIVVSYNQNEESQLTQFLASIASFPAVSVIPFPITAVSPVNAMKNAGIAAVRTTHYVFAEFDLVPSSNLYSVLKLTPGYLWRDPYFIGVIPAYEWAHPLYDEAAANWREFDRSPRGDKSIRQCLKEYRCRPIQTGTIPMQFRTFSYIYWRNMNCIDSDTEIYFMARKSEALPRYSESVVERGFDNVEMVERLRYTAAKFGMLCSGFLFRVPGVG